ncbi:hypothetical protein ACTGJ9_018460 [Bradyrhizobium sp. RDM12]
MSDAKATTTAALAASPFSKHHRSLLTELLAGAQELTAKIESAASVTELSTNLESAKAALLNCARHIYEHFETLEAKVKAETDANWMSINTALGRMK